MHRKYSKRLHILPKSTVRMRVLYDNPAKLQQKQCQCQCQ